MVAICDHSCKAVKGGGEKQPGGQKSEGSHPLMMGEGHARHKKNNNQLTKMHQVDMAGNGEGGGGR